MSAETVDQTPNNHEPRPPMSPAERFARATVPVAQLALHQFTLLEDGTWKEEVLEAATYTY